MSLILVVDDEDYLRTLIEEMLRSRGHEVIQAGSGSEAVRVCQDRKIDLVITDLAMPDMDGFDLISSLQQSHGHLPVLAMSGIFSEEFFKTAKFLGAVETLKKPFHQDDLFSLVDKILGRGERHATQAD